MGPEDAGCSVSELEAVVARVRDAAEANDFSGVVRVGRWGELVDEFARGMAHRANALPNAVDTRFATASATKGFTALTVMSLIEDGELTLDLPVRVVLGDRLPRIDDAVTIEQLLAHRSGIGDYLDEELLGDADEHVLGVSAHTLERPSDYLPLLEPHVQKSPPGQHFTYNNSGYMVLSLIVELVTGDFHRAVSTRVFEPAGVRDGGFFRSDDLPARTALGYLADGRTNIFHLPVIGGGDGGLYLSLDDMSSFWDALLAGRIVGEAAVQAMTSVVSENEVRPHYGLGFWLGDRGEQVMLVGMDAGVSFGSSFDLSTGLSYTLMSNTSDGVWPLARILDQ